MVLTTNLLHQITIGVSLSRYRDPLCSKKLIQEGKKTGTLKKKYSPLFDRTVRPTGSVDRAQ